jgi:class 3 adenylate cyclase
MQESTLTQSVLFADIVGSLQIYERLGDDHARRLVIEVLSDLSDIALKHKGGFLRTYGDELMCSFDSADNAVQAAASMHRIADARLPAKDSPIESIGLYIRIDTGTVIQVDNRLFGDVVNSAAKMKALAKPYQTLLSETTLNHLSPENRQLTRFVGKLPIKGKAGTYDIFEYIPEEEEATLLIDHPGQILQPSPILEVKCGNAHLSADENRPILSIGRLPVNDLVLKFAGISRMHARIEHRKGKFVLVDVSSNGTYIHLTGQKVIYLKHDELQLPEQGYICPGRLATPQSPGAIHFLIGIDTPFTRQTGGDHR